MKHTYRSEVNITRLPSEVMGVLATPRGPERVKVAIKSATGELLESAIPRVAIVKDGSYFQGTFHWHIDGTHEDVPPLASIARSPLSST